MTTADPDPHVLHTHSRVAGRMYEGGGGGYYARTDAGAAWTCNLTGMPDDVRYFTPGRGF